MFYMKKALIIVLGLLVIGGGIISFEYLKGPDLDKGVGLGYWERIENTETSLLTDMEGVVSMSYGIDFKSPLYVDEYPVPISFNNIKRVPGNLYESNIKLQKPITIIDYNYKDNLKNFREYYGNYFIDKGFELVDTYEKMSKTTVIYKKDIDDSVQFVVLVTDTLDTSDCPNSDKNIFGGCNMVTDENYAIFVSEPFTL